MSDRVFFVSQIGDKGSVERNRADTVHDGIVEPVAQEFGLTVHRADRDPKPGQLTSQIIRALVEARVVVADLTGRNPNVYYELGIAHAFQLPVAILVDKASSLSFDTQNEKVIEIGDDGTIGWSQARDAAKQLKEVFNVILDDDYAVENLLTSVATARSLEALAPMNPIASEIAGMREQLDEVQALLRRTRTSGHFTQDFVALRRFVEGQAKKGAFTPAEIADTVTSRTSSSYDEWATRVADMIPGPAGPSSYDDDEPF